MKSRNANAKQGNARDSQTGQFLPVRHPSKPIARQAIQVGAVTVQVPLPSSKQVRANVKAGTAALVRSAARIAKPGFSLVSKEGVALYRADPKDPSRLLRELDGKTDTGRFVAGKFKVSSGK